MAIKFPYGKKNEVEHETKHVKNVGIIVIPDDEEIREDVVKQTKKAEAKYIRLKEVSGTFAGLGAGVFLMSAASGASKAIKEKDISRGIAAGVAAFIGIGLGGATGFILSDAKNDKKNFKRKYGK